MISDGVAIGAAKAEMRTLLRGCQFLSVLPRRSRNIREAATSACPLCVLVFHANLMIAVNLVREGRCKALFPPGLSDHPPERRNISIERETLGP